MTPYQRRGKKIKQPLTPACRKPGVIKVNHSLIHRPSASPYPLYATISNILIVLKKILRTLPFVIVTILYLRLELSGERCWGLIEGAYELLLIFLLIVTFTISAVALRNWTASNFYSVTIIVGALLALILGMLYGDDLKGSRWITAQTEDERLEMILRKNGRFTAFIKEVDFGCSFSGSFQVIGDTIVFNEKVSEQPDFGMSTHYLLSKKIMSPIVDSSNIEKHSPILRVISIN